MRVDWKVHIIFLYVLLMTFLTNEIEVLQYWSKKFGDYKENYVDK